MSALLELPELGRVPRAYTVHQAAPLSAKAALALLDTPYGRDVGDVPMAAPVISRALRAWLQSFTEIPAEAAGAPSRKVCYHLLAEYSEPEEDRFAIELKTLRAAVQWRHVGQRLVQAEQLRGLGQSALVALERASAASLPILLPRTLVEMAGDAKYLKESLKPFPAWTLAPQPLPRATLEALANPRRTKFTGRLARAILQVEAAVEAAKGVAMPRTPSVLTAYPLVLSFEGGRDRWNTALAQITDDFRREHDETVIFRFMGEPAAATAGKLQAFLSSVASTAPILRSVDALVRILTTTTGNPDHDH